MNPPAPPATGRELPSLPQTPASISLVENGRMYSLDVVQQPVRARMCGFGDKDRRPITPPPCVRLVVCDAATQKEIDINEIDISYYVLTVDLWSADGKQEVNLVRHTTHPPAIGGSVATSYPPPAGERMPPPASGAASAWSAYPGYPTPPTHMYSTPRPAPVTYGSRPPVSSAYYSAGPGLAGSPYTHTPPSHYQYHPPSHHPYHPQHPSPPHHHQYHQPSAAPPHAPPPPPPVSQPAPPAPPRQPTGMFTRNLIGALSASAFRLTDPDNRIGVWFILQDLSVRTEGMFRLKMSFVNVGDGTKLNTGSAPVLASTYSDVFQVFSAKKFPGVIESTNLSKCFATQGIKIPIRKDGPRHAASRDEYDDDS
ncbi:MAG: hypothetical protein M1826_007114 [Phylliscum demangeonii]|nr:MAG: hypothetical protein M1826_007114 [Phylliscum demangeonii]